jgi:hypothetical protein
VIRPRWVTWYTAWSDRVAFPAAQASAVVASGATPVVTWEPWDPTHGVDQPTYALDRTTAGRHDGYTSSWAKQVRSWGRPLVLRRGHGMNGSCYP